MHNISTKRYIPVIIPSTYGVPDKKALAIHEAMGHKTGIATQYANRGLQTLHALRLGICLKVERGEITLDEGTIIFEDTRRSLIAQKEEAKRKATLREKPTF